ncbi:HAD family hydrolase [Staphylococcus massiliensis]|uniref:HAD family hydrolase n=1 Tax=Staphylococcus massiliensis TaxID=555791 RepID=UPI001EDF6493|nr:HAD family hydrolase [Staphylococcus massiliensis]MCG3401960.1 HAD family hydrolase [Staphylococcus massiliensis]
MWLLFDKDGTLIEYDETWVEIGIEMIDDFIGTYHIHDKDRVYRDIGVKDHQFVPGGIMAQGTMDDIIQCFNHHAQQDVSEWTKKTSQRLISSRNPETTLIPGVVETLTSLKAQGHRLGIITSDNQVGTKKFLNDFDLTDMFDYLITTDEKSFEKPDPRVLEAFFKETNCTQDDIIIIGDAPTDIETGQRVGAQTIGVLTGIGDRDTLHNATHIIDDITALPELLRN